MKDKTEVPLNKFAFTAGGSLDLKAGDGTLTIESSVDQLSIMSDFNITRDAAGLELARNMVDVLLGAIQTLKDDQQAGRLPQTLSVKKAVVRDNPLA